MEYAAGGSLHSILSSQLKAKLSPNARLYVTHALVAALEYLHSHHIFHRDVKPENICLWEDWETNPKMILIDFGIASRVAERQSGMLLSKLPGTIPYMADECLRIPQQFTEKSEVFACGVVFLNLLTGRCYWSFDHRTVGEDTVLAHLDESAGPWLANTDAALAALACKCLLKNPDARPTMSNVLTEVARLRDLASADEFLDMSVKNCVQSHNRQSRPSVLPPVVGESRCIVCGRLGSEGVLCINQHFTCSSGSCLEEMVREQLGNPKFKCPSLSCARHFFLIDVYGKIAGDLFGQAVVANTQVEGHVRNEKELANSIAQGVTKALKVELNHLEQSFNGELQRSVGDIVANLSSVYDTNLELSSLKAQVAQLLGIAEGNSRQQAQWKTDLQNLLDKEAVGGQASEEEQKAMKEAVCLLSSKIESLSLSHANGVSLLASGRLQCPRLCLLWPVRSRPGIRSKLSIAKQYQLVFLCAHDRSPITTSVIIKDPKKWLRAATPVIKFSLFSIRVLAAVYGGIPVPSLPDSIVGNSLRDRVDQVLQEMALLLKAEDMASLEKWLSGVANRSDLLDAIARRDGEIPEEAYAALVEEAYKPQNRGWMDEMEIAQRGGSIFAWVKKENAGSWRSAV
jgi:serine/threonine protein kinase